MKVSRLTLVILVSAVVAAGVSTTNAFHSGGVAECVGCHSMHEALGGALLTANDASSTCLNCHEDPDAGGYHVSQQTAAGIPPGNFTPGGDFGWLLKDYNWNPGWEPQSEDGDRHGHNIVAVDYGYTADTTHLVAPGGGGAAMDAADLSCVSCHDQHGKLRRLNDGSIVTTGAPIIGSGSYGAIPAAGQAVGVYRLLRGAGSDPGTGITFTNPVPAAVVPSSYNRAEDVTDTRVAYGAGMSEFCGTCHSDMHIDSGNLIHTVDAPMSAARAADYSNYVGSGDLSGNQVQGVYDSLVPFQTDNSTDYVALAALADNTGTVVAGPTGLVDRVLCQSCHRSHASGWEYMTRWDNEIELIIVDGEWPGTDAVSTEAAKAKWAKGRTTAERAGAYNNTLATDYATHQRVLCNKCHAKD